MVPDVPARAKQDSNNGFNMNPLRFRPPATAIAIGLAALLLGACAAPGGQDALMRVYDLGLAPQSTPAAAVIAARIAQVRASAPFDGTDMHYRLAYRDGAELLAYSQSRWAAPPAKLIRKRLVRATAAATGAACTLEIEVLEFSQVYAAADASEALLELRATLAGSAARLAERSIRVALPAGAGAAPGAGVMARVVDTATVQLAAWVGQHPGCKAHQP